MTKSNRVSQRFLERLREADRRPLLFDGAMGTMLADAGLSPGVAPELWNVERSEAVTAVHRAYIEAGAEIIETNSFGANRIKLAHYGLADEVAKLNAASVACARAAAGDRVLVAGSVGPTGQLMTPFGILSFDEAYAAFAEQCRALAEVGADLILIETMSDIAEARAAVIAAKENTTLPVVCTMSFTAGQKTLGGTEPEAVATILAGLGCDAVGANCSVGPDELVPVIERMVAVSRVPVLVQPNAGLPFIKDGATVFPLEPEEMGRAARKLVESGASLLGGCCGTSPAHIKAMVAACASVAPGHGPSGDEDGAALRPLTYLAGRGKAIALGGSAYPVAIGERINPTARKKFAAALTKGDYAFICEEARAQVEAGAGMLDVNVGLPGIDESEAMRASVDAVQVAVPVPLSIDSARPEVIAAGLATYHGRALLNSVNGKEDVLRQLLPVAKRFGAVVLGLTLDEEGIPETAEKRLAIAERIVEASLAMGLARRDILIDCLVLAAAAQQDAVGETLKAIRLVKERLGVGTVLGVSNVSHGLPGRPPLNAAYLAMALGAGLDAAIVNPLDTRMWESLRASAVLTNRDPHATVWIPYGKSLAEAGQGAPTPASAPAPAASVAEPPASPGLEAALVAEVDAPWRERLRAAIVFGDRRASASAVEDGIGRGSGPAEMLNEILIPALTEVGERYERGEFFLPQLMLAAEAMRAAFARLEPLIAREGAAERSTVILATVHGDVHDIGKNIVGVMLANHGFHVVDLGRDVPTEAIVSAAIDHKARLVGLSALMTTTMQEMGKVISALRDAGSRAQVMVGGAVVTPSFAAEIGADGYARDAVSAVAKAKELTESDRSL